MTTQARAAVVMGLGQLGGVFAHGFLRSSRSVFPMVRQTEPASLVSRVDPELVLVAVGEDDLPRALARVPRPWRARLALVQNELLPDVWESAGIPRPTVAVVWFEKKRGTGIHPILPTPVAGPLAEPMLEAMAALGIPAVRIAEGPPLLDALVAKNLFVVAANVAGLAGEGDTMGALARAPRFRVIGDEVLDLQASRAPSPLDRAKIWDTVEAAMSADPDHGSRGRSAPHRLARALRDADAAGLAVPTLRAVAREAGVEAATP